MHHCCSPPDTLSLKPSLKSVSKSQEVSRPHTPTEPNSVGFLATRHPSANDFPQPAAVKSVLLHQSQRYSLTSHPKIFTMRSSVVAVALCLLIASTAAQTISGNLAFKAGANVTLDSNGQVQFAARTTFMFDLTGGVANLVRSEPTALRLAHARLLIFPVSPHLIFSPLIWSGKLFTILICISLGCSKLFRSVPTELVVRATAAAAPCLLTQSLAVRTFLSSYLHCVMNDNLFSYLDQCPPLSLSLSLFSGFKYLTRLFPFMCSCLLFLVCPCDLARLLQLQPNNRPL